MSNKCNPRMTTSCEKRTLATGDTEKSAYVAKDISVCLPFGGELYTDGGILKHEPASNPPADGVYGKVVVKNGCIIDVQPEDVALHTSAPCAPIPSPCDCGEGGGSGGSGMAQPSTTAGNLFEYDAAGRPLVRVFMEEGSGIAIDGTGTKSNPFVLSADVEVGGAEVLASGALYTEDTGVATMILHRDGRSASINGMEFDAYGHLIGYSDPSQGESAIKQITAVMGDNYTTIGETNQLTGIATVALRKPDEVYDDKFNLGGYEIEYDEYNRIKYIVRKIDIDAGKYTLGGFDVTFNEYGSVTDIRAKENVGAVTTSVSKVFTSGQQEWKLTFTTEEPSSFRISVKCSAQPQALTVQIDGVDYSTSQYKFGTNLLEVVPNATFPAGSHTVTLYDSADGDPIRVTAVVDIFLSIVV